MGGSNAISVRVQPITSGKLTGQRRHDLRHGRPPGYVDQRLTQLNETIIEPPTPDKLRAEIAAARAKHRQQKLREDARIAVAGIITFGSEAQARIRAMSADEQRRCTCASPAVAESSGHELVGLVVHNDESAPHAHFLLRGYRRDARGLERPWRKSPKDLALLQDAAAGVVAELGIERGREKSRKLQGCGGRGSQKKK